MSRSNAPLVTIGLPVYNGEKYIVEAVRSFLEQTYSNFELIISDNASTDATSGICETFVNQDLRVRYNRFKNNRGATLNYNNLVAVARGKYFKWAAHDDVCAPQYLERCVEILEENPDIVLCYPKTKIIDKKGEFIGDFNDGLHLNQTAAFIRYRYFHRRFSTPAECNAVFGLIRSDILRKTGLICNYPGGDKLLLAELAMRGLFYEIPEALFYRRDHSETSLGAYRSVAQRVAWFDPRKKKRIVFPYWRWFWEYLRAVNSAPVNVLDKLRCHWETTRWAFKYKRKLFNDLIKAIKQILQNT